MNSEFLEKHSNCTAEVQIIVWGRFSRAHPRPRPRIRKRDGLPTDENRMVLHSISDPNRRSIHHIFGCEDEVDDVVVLCTLGNSSTQVDRGGRAMPARSSRIFSGFLIDGRVFP
jgi:hypothetical protein